MSTKAQKLTAPVALIVPIECTGRTPALEIRWGEFKKAVATIAGGYTISNHSGGWIYQTGPRKGELVEELTVRIEARLPIGADQWKGKALLDEFQDYLHYLLDVAGEEAVFVELPDNGAYIAFKAPVGDPAITDLKLVEGDKDAQAN